MIIFSRKRIVFILFFGFFSVSLFSQTLELSIVESIGDWISNPSKELTFNINVNSMPIEERTLLISKVEQSCNDSIFDVRWRALTVSGIMVSANNGDKANGRLLSLLLNFLQDNDTRITYTASQYISNINKVSYTEEQKDLVVELLEKHKNPSVLVSLYKICGEQEILKSAPHLDRVSSSSSVPFFQRWVALATLTRIGDTEAESSMNAYLNKIGISLDAINTLYPYILFSRSRANTNHLLSIIKTEDSGCESRNPNSTKLIPCAYYTLRVVAQEVKELNWEGVNGLENLPIDDALKSARVVLNRIDDNWTFID
jgi:hypothetical protein